MPIRLAGLSSNLDTDSIVKAMVSSYSLKKDNLVKARTKLSWTQDAWKSMNTKIYDFYSGKLSKMRLSSTYGLKAATVSDSTVAKVTAASGAVNNTQTLKVKHLAASGYLTGGQITGTTTTVKGDSKLSDITGLEDLTSGQIAVSAGGKDTNISITGDLTVNKFIAKLKDAGVNASFDENNQRFFISAKEPGKDNDFSLTANDAGGLNALSNMGLYTSNTTENAEYKAWATYSDEELTAIKDSRYDASKTDYKTVQAEYKKNYASSLSKIKSANTAIESLTKSNEELAKKKEELDTKIAAIQSDYDALPTKTETKRDDNGETIVTTTVDVASLTAEQKKIYNEYTDLSKQLKANVTTTEANNKKLATNNKTITDQTALRDEYVNYVFLDTDSDEDIQTKKDAINQEVENRNNNTRNTINTEVDAKAAFAKTMYDVNTDTFTSTSISGPSANAVRTTGVDSEIELNGAKYTSNSNDYQINGLTIQVSALTGQDSSGNDKSVSITTNTDIDGIYKMVKDFFTDYNALIKSMDTAYNADSSKGYEPLTSDEKEAMTDSEVEEWEKKIKDALLRNDTLLGGSIDAMKTGMLASYEINGTTYSLSSFGIATQGYFSSATNEKGVFHIDGDSSDSVTSGNTDKLRAAISSNPEDFVTFFNKLTDGVYSSLSKKMSTSSVSSAYTIYNDKQMKTQYSQYTTKISDWEDKISDYETKYYKQFSSMESALSKLNSQQSSLSSLLGS